MQRKKENARAQNDELEAAWEKFVAFIKTKGDRVTCARRIVFDRVLGRHDHFRADDLAAELSLGAERVSRGTVYRTLSLLEEGGFVCTVRDGGAHRHYEHTWGHAHHDHMVCRQCGAFFDFEDEELDRMLDDNCRKRSFKPEQHKLVIFGLCSTCARHPGAARHK